jgi:hypothetical protein
MSDEGVRLVMRAALVVCLIVAAAFFRALVGPGKRRGRVMVVGMLGGLSAGALLAQPIYTWFDVEASVLLASAGMVLGWAVAWMWARRIPRAAS